MHISWLGGSAIKIQTKPLSEDVTIVIDPYKPAKGSFPRSLSPQIALYTHMQEGSITLSGDPFILSSPGECETKGVLVTAVQGETADQIFFRIDSEYMSVAHLGRATKPLTDKQLEVVGDVDVLILPVGGEGCYSAEDAVKTVNAVEPRIVIPTMFHSDIDPKAAPASAFVKAFGAKETREEAKLLLKKKDLPQEETHVIILSKE